MASGKARAHRESRMNSLSVKVFLMIFCGVMIPLYLLFGYVRASYENYLKEEIGAKIIQTISKGEESIGVTFQKMANLSNILVLNEDLLSALSNDGQNYYDNTKVFNKVLSDLIVNNLFDMDGVLVTVFDSRGDLYANWETNYENYSSILQQDWVRESIQRKGHIVWELFSPPYIHGESPDVKYLSLARSMLRYGVTGDYLATVIISIRQDALISLLLQYAYDESDCVYLSWQGDGAVLKYDPQGVVLPEKLREIEIMSDGQDSGGLITPIEKNQFLVCFYSFASPLNQAGNQFKVFHFTDYQHVDSQLSQISLKMRVRIYGAFLLALALAVLIVGQIVKPIKHLATQMDEYSIEGEIHALDILRQDEIGVLNRSFYTMSEKLKLLFAQLNEEYAIKEKYRFESLRAQLNPHFLFNTLNTIRWMAIIRKADNITESIDALANMLKYSMNRGSDMVPLAEELGNIKDYVFIQNCRYGDQYEIQVDVGEGLLGRRVIKFILQPVVENAILHAFKNRNGRGIICLSAEIRDGKLMLYVEDNGVGMPEDVHAMLMDMRGEEGRHSGKRMTGIGLRNVDERIRVFYGDEYGLEVRSREGHGTRVTYTLPLLAEEGTDETAVDS